MIPKEKDSYLTSANTAISPILALLPSHKFTATQYYNRNYTPAEPESGDFYLTRVEI